MVSVLQVVAIVIGICVGIVGIIGGILKAFKDVFELKEKRYRKSELAQRDARVKPALAVGPPFPREPRRTFWR